MSVKRPVAALLEAASRFAAGREYSGSRYREGEPDDRLATLKLLIDAHANVNAADAEGRSALRLAVEAYSPNGCPYAEAGLESVRALLVSRQERANPR